MTPDPTSLEFFEQKYQRNPDPWEFASSPYEQSRYDAIFNALCHRRYERAFEPGCSIGVLTTRLAAICGQVEAMDISPTAVRHACERCRSFPGVNVSCGALPGHLPSGTFDLVVLSEIGYYFNGELLVQLGKDLVSRMPEGGILLATHWLGVSEDHFISGDLVHQILGTLDGLHAERSERHAQFRLDRWQRG